MRYLVLIILQLYCSLLIHGQDLTQNDFDLIDNDINNNLLSIKSDLDFIPLLKFLNIDEAKIDSLKQHFTNIPFNNGKDYNYVLSYYKEGNSSKNLSLTIFPCIMNPKADSDLSKPAQAKYPFIIECFVELDGNRIVSFSNPELLSNESDVINWFVDVYKNYVIDTGIIHDKYGHIPPPPPPLPNIMTYTPSQIENMTNKYMESKEWDKAESSVNKLISYYPDDASFYLKRGYIKILGSREGGCNDVERALNLNLLKTHPQLKENYEKIKIHCKTK